MWELAKALLGLVGLIGGLIGFAWFMKWWQLSERRRYLESLPAPTLHESDVRRLALEVFEEICARADSVESHVSMKRYFTERGWNRADVLLITEEPCHRRKLIKERFFPNHYSPTELGLQTYARGFVSDSRGDVYISADNGGIVAGVNANSPSSNAQTGNLNHTNQTGTPLDQLIEALRRDAQNANQVERMAADQCADSLEEAAAAQDATRIDRAIGRVKELIAIASSGFTLTRELIGS